LKGCCGLDETIGLLQKATFCGDPSTPNRSRTSRPAHLSRSSRASCQRSSAVRVWWWITASSPSATTRTEKVTGSPSLNTPVPKSSLGAASGTRSAYSSVWSGNMYMTRRSSLPILS
jgi:hypothetical protein